MATNKEWAMRMIPVLIRWAQSSWDKTHYYSHLSTAVGHRTNQIGSVMGIIQDLLDELKVKSGRNDIPTLNGLVQNKGTGLPSDGFDYVIKNYSNLSPESKKGEVRKLNFDAHQYDWTWVLNALGLEPARVLDTKTVLKIKADIHGYGGEGQEHKSIKEYIANHPESIGLKNVKKTLLEYDLLSGDRLDIYFECQNNKHIAVEVKPSISPDGDVLRGIFQCIKYQSVMDASRVLDNDNYDNEVLLVIAGPISEANKQIANDLGIKYLDNYTMK